MDDKLPDTIQVMATAARSDPRITITDIIDQMQAERALLNWSQGIHFDRTKAQELLLTNHPHLQSSVP